MRMFCEELVNLDFEAKDKEECISKMIDILDKNQRLNDKAEYMKAVYKREEEYSTGIGLDVAIPHGQSDAVNCASLLFVRCKNGIDFEAADGSLAHLIFMIAVPQDTANMHLKILAMLSRKLMHEDFRLKLMNTKTAEEVVKLIDIT